MKLIILPATALILALALCACSNGGSSGNSSPSPSPSSAQPSQTPSQDVTSQEPASEPSSQAQGGRGDIIAEQIPPGADVIRQGVFFYQLLELSDSGDGLSPKKGAELTDELLAYMGFYSNNGGIPAGQCVYISLDQLEKLDSAMGRECYIYSVGLGTAEGGLKGGNYQVVYRVSVDYSGKKTAALFEDFSNGNKGEGRGDLIPDDTGDGRGDLIPDDTGDGRGDLIPDDTGDGRGDFIP